MNIANKKRIQKRKAAFSSSRYITQEAINEFFRVRVTRRAQTAPEEIISLLSDEEPSGREDRPPSSDLPPLDILSQIDDDSPPSSPLMATDKATQTDENFATCSKRTFLRDFALISSQNQARMQESRSLSERQLQIEGEYQFFDKIGHGSHNRKRMQKENLELCFDKFLKDKNLERDQLSFLKMKDLIAFLIIYSDGKGRCNYRTGKKGICPRTAFSYAAALRILLEERGMQIDSEWPMWQQTVNDWVRELSTTKLYHRKHAGFWTKDELRQCMRLLLAIERDNQGLADAHYAILAQAVISMVYTQTGSRIGELLQARALSVYFGEVSDKLAGQLQHISSSPSVVAGRLDDGITF